VATAVPDDVTLEGGGIIATDLTDAQIQSYIDDAAYEAGAVIADYEDWDAEDKRQLEKYLAALKVRTISDKAVSSTSRETASVSYEGGGMSISELRTQVNRRDPTGTLATNTDATRYVGSTYRDDT